MKRPNQKRMIAAILTAFAVPAAAQFAVIDAGAIAQAVQEVQQLSQQYTQMVNQYNQLLATYTMITNQYNQMLANARGLGSLPQRFIAPFTQWKSPSTQSRYGTSGAWVNALLSGSNAPAGYTAATIPLPEYDWSFISPAAQVSDALHYSTVELTDGLIENSMATVGNIRANATTAGGAILELEANTDGQSEDPSEVQALQNIGSANVIALHNQQDTNQILASLLETEAISQKAQRDAFAGSVTDEIAFSNNIAAHYDALFGPHIQEGVDSIGNIP